MQLSVTFRHMEPSEPIKQYVTDKLERIKKFFPDPIRAQIVMSLERYLHRADIIITLHNGLTIKSGELTDNMYSSIDLVMDKIERQIIKYKEKIYSHRPAMGPELLISYEVMEPVSPPLTESSTPGQEYKVIKSSKFYAKPMSIDEAIMQMNLLNNEFLVFTNADTNDVNVVYRQNDGNYGLIETGKSAEKKGP